MIAAPEFAKPVIAMAEPLLGSGGLKKTVKVKLMAAGKKEDWLFIKKYPGLNELRIRDHMFGGGIIADGKEAMLLPRRGQAKPSHMEQPRGLSRFCTRVLPVPMGLISNRLKKTVPFSTQKEPKLLSCQKVLHIREASSFRAIERK